MGVIDYDPKQTLRYGQVIGIVFLILLALILLSA